MKLNELKLIKESLEELSPNVEDFSWGPSYEMAMQRRRTALAIVCEKIRGLTPITWNNAPLSVMRNREHIYNTIKQLHSWARDRAARGGYQSKLYNGFTIAQTINALQTELECRKR